MHDDIKIDIAHASGSDIKTIQRLWREYWRILGLPLDFQNFAAELESLPGAYAPPKGCLLLARMDGTVAGTIALRSLDAYSCEAKRLYVPAEYRGLGIGKRLLDQLVEQARTIGYRDLYCDSLPSLKSALRIYKSMGFVEVGPYSSTPTPGALYFKLAL